LLSSKIKFFQSDGGTEFSPLQRQFPEITFQKSCPYSSEQNGLAQRKHRHIVELALANMFHTSIPLKYWDYIFESVVFIINRLPSSVHGTISPFQQLFNQVPDYTFLHILGYTCYPLLRPYTQHKLEARSEVCAFLGYFTIHKDYYCLHIPSGRIYVSRHVTFDDHTFPFMNHINSAHAPISSTSQRTVLTILPHVPMSNISSNSSQVVAPDTTTGSTSSINTDITPAAETSSFSCVNSTCYF
jgi:hypothetical protein